MDVEMLSPKQERQLVSSLKTAIHDVNGGMDPNAAIAKQASEHNFGPEFAARMVEAYNTSKTLSHMKNSEGEKRAESFGIADISEVHKRMYDTSEKVSKVVRYNNAANADFNKPTFRDPQLDKTASAIIPQHEKTAMYAQPKKVLRDAKGMLQKIAHDRDSFRAMQARAKEDILKLAHEIAQSFRVPGCVPFEEVEKRAWYTFGDAARKGLDIVWSMVAPDAQAREKRASAKPEQILVMPNGGVFEMVRDYVSAVEKAASLAAEAAEFSRKATLVEDHLSPKLSLLNHRKQAADGDAKSKPKPKPSGGAGPKPAGGLQGILNDFLPSKPPKPKDRVLTPVHEGELRGIRAKLMINDMMSNDPNLSAYPIEDLVGAYNSIAETFPAVSTNPLLMRQLLGSVIQREGRFDPMELRTLLQTEEAQRGLRVKGT